MSLNKQQAIAQLARALGVPDKPRISRDLAARALAEALSGHAQASGTPTVNDMIPARIKPPAEAVALTELHEVAHGESVEQFTHRSTGNVEPSADMQEAVNKAVARALAAHGIGNEK